MTGGWRWEVNATVVADSTVLHFPSSACLTQVFTSCIPWAFVVPCAFVHAPFLTAWCVSLFPAHLCLVFFFSPVYLNSRVSSVLGLSVFMITRCSFPVSRCLTAPFLFVPACVSVKIPSLCFKVCLHVVHLGPALLQQCYPTAHTVILSITISIPLQYRIFATEYFTVL